MSADTAGPGRRRRALPGGRRATQCHAPGTAATTGTTNYYYPAPTQRVWYPPGGIAGRADGRAAECRPARLGTLVRTLTYMFVCAGQKFLSRTRSQSPRARQAHSIKNQQK
jgi:hypothetical protein